MIDTGSSLLHDLLELDGVKAVEVDVQLSPIVSLQSTGEVDEYFNTVQERTISEEQMRKMVSDTEWSYHGAVDVIGDFSIKDRFSLRQTVDNDD